MLLPVTSVTVNLEQSHVVGRIYSPQGAHPLSRSSVHWQQILTQEVVLLLMHAVLHTKARDPLAILPDTEPLL